MVKVSSILTVLSLLVALIGYLPLMPYLDPFARWFFPGALALGLYRQRRGESFSERVLTPASVLLFLYLASSFSQQNLLPVTSDLLVTFLGIRMLGEKSGRNYLQVFALALFCLAASSLYNLSALFLVYLLALLLLLAVSLVVLTFHSYDAGLSLRRPELRKVLGVALLMPVAALPILLFLFVLLPRTQFPLWDFLNRGGGGVTGLSQKVSPGQASSVAESSSIVLRAISPKVPESSLYWRGIVLNGYQGNAWVRLAAPQERTLGTGKGERVRQEIFPEPSSAPYLLALNIPRQISGMRSTDSADAVYQSPRPLDKRVKYEALSSLSDTIRVQGEIDRAFYLAPPQTVSPRLRAQAAELARRGGSTQEKLALLEQFYRSQRISYATSGLPVGPDAIDSFLFFRKRGNCEYFASSAATLLRLAGVPARLVGGFRGGSYNDMGGYYLVTTEMAHVWVEAFVEGRGWVTVDPTAWSVGFARNDGVGRTVRMYLDAVGFYWNKAVITYDLDQQISLLRNAGKKARQLRFPTGIPAHARQVIPWLLPVAGLAALLLLRPAKPEERLLRAFLRAVRRRYPELASQNRGLFELAQQTGDPGVQEFAAIYGAALYGDRRLQDAELTRLKEVIRLLSQHPA